MKKNNVTVKTLATFAFANALVLSAQAKATFYPDDSFPFDLVRPAVVGKNCAPKAKGKVIVKSFGNVEIMDVKIEGLPKNTEFDVFVIQVPNFPFGMSWYQGDIQTNRYGKGFARFAGRFNEETFVVALRTAPAPKTHDADAQDNPPTAPVHTYHVGIWFNSPADALKAGCSGGVTPFNGEHNAGIQILNTSTFADDEGPLLEVKPSQ